MLDPTARVVAARRLVVEVEVDGRASGGVSGGRSDDGAGSEDLPDLSVEPPARFTGAASRFVEAAVTLAAHCFVHPGFMAQSDSR
jgi:hypothetical protein